MIKQTEISQPAKYYIYVLQYRIAQTGTSVSGLREAGLMGMIPVIFFVHTNVFTLSNSISNHAAGVSHTTGHESTDHRPHVECDCWASC